MNALKSLIMTNAVVISITLCINGHALAEDMAKPEQQANGVKQNIASNPYPSDNNKYDGDILKLLVDVSNFKNIDDSKAANVIAPKGAEIAVTKDNGETLYVRVKSLSDTRARLVDKNIQYVIDKDTLNQYSYERNGDTLKLLVDVPRFKKVGDSKAGNVIASKGVEIVITKDNGNTLSVRVKSLPNTQEAQFVDENIQYVVERKYLNQYSFKRT